MAELLSPGVFIQEAPSQVQVVGPVSTSTMAIVGFTASGPTDKATLVTSFNQFVQTFGQISKLSYVGLSVAAFFANGGRRCYVVRVVPDDAVAADAKLQSLITDQVVETGDGVTTSFTETALTTPLKVHGGASPIVSGALSTNTFRWRAAGTPVVAGILKKRDGVTNLVMVPSQAAYEGTIDPTTLPAYDPALDSVVRGTATLKFTLTVGGLQTVAIPVGTSSIVTVTTGVAPDQTTATLDHRTGRLSVLTTGAKVPGVADTGNFTMDFTPASVTKVASDPTGGGTLSGDVTAGTITYATGAYSLTMAAGNQPANQMPIVATYKINAWDVNPISAGTWGNNLRIDVKGNADSYVSTTSSYSKYDVNVLMKDSTGAYTIVEHYESLDFDTPTDALYFPDVVNSLSSLVSIASPDSNEVVAQLNGVARSKVIAGGDAIVADQILTSAAASTNTVLTGGPLASRSVVISYTDTTGTARTVTDDGAGNLIGDVDASYVTTVTVGGVTLNGNAMSYTTGAFNFKASQPIKGGTLVVASYHQAAVEATHSEIAGDSTKAYTAGTDGTFNSTHFSRSQFTSPTLSAAYKGLYALNRVDEILQVIVPDFAGDVTVTGDLLDYAASRASAPSGGDRFIILTVPKGSTAQQASDWFRFTLGRFSDFAALYWPWVKVADPNSNNRPLTMPPLGHVAGVYARTDVTKNVGKAPGGTIDGALNFLLGLEIIPTQGERDLVYPNKINPLISSPQTGVAVWGVRTISTNSDWKYVNARRLFMFLEKSIYNATFWIVFENNGSGLWARIKAQINGFLLPLFNDNYFAGNSPSQAFLVIVDDSNNTADTINQGVVNIKVAVAPNRPAEFVVFTLSQKTLT